MFDTVVSSISFERHLDQSIDRALDTEEKIKSNGKLTTEVGPEWRGMNVAENFHK